VFLWEGGEDEECCEAFGRTVQRMGHVSSLKGWRRCTMDMEHGRMVALLHGRDWAEGRWKRGRDSTRIKSQARTSARDS
jgi:hypothetical protein